MTAQDSRPGPSADGSREPVGVPVGEPALPEQSREDTDAAWGEYQVASDERLYRDRPPHWDDY